MEQSGGLKLKNKQKTGFIPIYDMINSPGSRVTLLTASSLKGFMVKLDVLEEHSEYLNLGKGNKFNTPVTSFILKFAVITDRPDTRLPRYLGKSKSSESEESYFEEAKLQQKIWKKSIIGGGEVICPSVANLCFFDPMDSVHLIRFFQSKPLTTNLTEVFDYLFETLTSTGARGVPGSRIGVLVMPTIPNSMTFCDFETANVDAVLFPVVIYIVAQILRLYVEIGVIHFDLHAANDLVYEINGTYDSMIIDFGRASDLTNGLADDFMTESAKTRAEHVRKIELDNCFAVNLRSNKEKINFMKKNLKYLTELENATNKRIFGGNFDRKSDYQMNWIESYIHFKPSQSDADDNILLEIFEVLIQMISVKKKGITGNTISKFQKNGEFIDFYKKNITKNDFITSFPDLAAPPSLVALPSRSRSRSRSASKSASKSKSHSKTHSKSNSPNEDLGSGCIIT